MHSKGTFLHILTRDNSKKRYAKSKDIEQSQEIEKLKEMCIELNEFFIKNITKLDNIARKKHDLDLVNKICLLWVKNNL